MGFRKNKKKCARREKNPFFYLINVHCAQMGDARIGINISTESIGATVLRSYIYI